MTKINNQQLQESLINNYSFCIKNSDFGYMLTNKDGKIVFANGFCNHYLGDPEPNMKSMELFKKVNYHAIVLMNKNLCNYESLLTNNEKIIAKIHEVTTMYKLPIKFIFFIVHEQKFKSLSAHFIPVVDKNGELAFVQMFFSWYDLWGTKDGFNVYNRQSIAIEFLHVGNLETLLPIQLSARQSEILFLLAQGIGTRVTAKYLKMSYGALTQALKTVIFPKFNINTNKVKDLIAIAVQLGYGKIVPQSLIKPIILVQDFSLWTKYFTELEIFF